MITEEIELNASLDKVWQYCTLPDHITQWNFASEEWCCPSAINDLHSQGKLNWSMEAKDGSMGFDFKGICRNIVERMFNSYEIEDGRKVEISFVDELEKVKLIETFEPKKINSEELQREGWQAILNNFKKYLASNGI